MVIVGYQGIGKSTLAANKDNNFIDLESGNFWVDGKRDEKWYVPYCSIAASLSEQGFNVFVSSHEVVRKELAKYNVPKLVICPSHNLKEQWIKKLKDRYEASGLDKDYKAWKNAEDRYDENIDEIINSEGFFVDLIMEMDYNLYDIIWASHHNIMALMEEDE